MTNKMVPSIILSVFAFVIAIVIVYFLGGVIEESFWVKGMKIDQWKALLMKEVAVTGVLMALCAITWIVRTYTMDTITEKGQANPRPLWIMLFLVAAAISLVVPFSFTVLGLIPHLHVFNILASGAIFTITYYFVTVFCTPVVFQYAPLGASAIRG